MRLAALCALTLACVRAAPLGSDLARDADVDVTPPVDAPVFDLPRDLAPDRDTLDAPDVPDTSDAPDVRDAAVDVRVLPGGTVTSIAAGSTHSCAARSDGSLWCWGDNAHGQLGDGTTTSRNAPTHVPGLRDVRAVATGEAHTCARVGDAGRVWCWGDAGGGRLVVAATGDVLTPRDTGVDATLLAAGGAFTCWARAGRVRCAGADDQGQRGAATGAELPIPSPVVELAAGEAFACARTDDGVVWCWGRNVEGQAGVGAASPTSPPTRLRGALEGVTVAALAVGRRHACARTADAAWCWGDDASGQLGDGTPGAPTTAPATAPWPRGAIVAGGDFTCVADAQSVACAGANDAGQLGTTGPSRARPDMPVQGFSRVGVGSLAAGARHACAQLSDGRTWCWGEGTRGQLGGASSASSSMPVTVEWPR